MNIIKLCYFGDSITYGLGHDHQGVNIIDRWSSLVDQKLKILENKNIFVYSINLGVNGDTTRNGLERLPEVYIFNPDLIMIQFGMNDCNYWFSDNGLPRVNTVSFKHNLLELINKCLSSGVKQIILSTNHLIPVNKKMVNNQYYNENNSIYNVIIREVVKETNTVLCDIENYFINYSENKVNFLNEENKWIHLSTEGNKLYSDIIFPIIKKELMKLVDIRL
tara:strand:- start:1340 stop:2002 length:663 start_codon:yes stop_codon:yes gene_type:complete